MKRNAVLLIIIFAVILISIVSYIQIEAYQTHKIREFSFDEYSDLVDELNLYDENKNQTITEDISNTDTLLNETKKLWIKEYGEDVLDGYNVRIYYDKVTNYYMLRGEFPFYFHGVGGGPVIIISKPDGEVIGLWHEK